MLKLQYVILVLVLALSVHITRFLPFIVFGKRDTLPPVLDYLGRVLPAAMMGLLVVYCFKDISFTSLSDVLPALVASATVAAAHLLKRNTILSISLGTAVYMLLIRIL